MYKIVENNIGRAGNRQQANEKQKRWNQKYGEGNWLTGYEFKGEFLTREQAIDKIYDQSYFQYLDKNPKVVEEIKRYKGVFNPHAEFTNSVDLQAITIKKYFESRNLQFEGKIDKFLPVGVWQPKYLADFKKKVLFKEAKEKYGLDNDNVGFKYPNVSYQLSPFKIKCWHDFSLSVEAFWQSSAKCLAIKL